MSIATGTYFDGSSAAAQAVTLEFTEAALRLTGDNFATEIALAEVRVSDRLGQVPRFLYLPGDAVIESPDNAIIDAALEQRQQNRGSRLIHLLETQREIAVAACVLLVAAIAALGFYGPPILARVVANRVPVDIDQHIGAVALTTIRPYFAPSALRPAERERVQRQLVRLQTDPQAPLPQIEFLSMNGGLPNAFALPGNIIVVTDELVRLPATDDELAAVLAHELGHLSKRHGVQSLLRQSIAVLIVAAVTGDLATLTSFASTIPLTILTAGYSREFEREADQHALELLRTHHIDLHAFVAVLTKLEASRETLQRNSTYLSTHPSTEERIALFGGRRPRDEAVVHLGRGKKFLQEENFSAALGECNAAITDDPSLGEAYVSRSAARRRLTQSPEALADLEEAIRRGVPESRLLDTRAHLYFDLGDTTAAMRDFDRALLRTVHSTSYRGRAMLKYALADWTGAEADFARYLADRSPSTEEYGQFYRYFLGRRRHDPNAFSELKGNVGSWPATWGKSVGLYLTKQLDEAQLLAAAHEGKQPTETERLCEAQYYIGEFHLLAGDRTGAAEHFAKCVAAHVTYYYETSLARLELERLQRETATAGEAPPPPSRPAKARPATATKGDTLPRLIHQVQPQSPPAMRAQHIEGRVTVDFFVDPVGDVQNPSVAESNRPEFDEPALAAVQQWRYEPARVNSQPVNCHVRVTVLFTLDDKAPSATKDADATPLVNPAPARNE